MTDLWKYLASADKPIVMYGTGNGGDKIFAELDRLGITVSDIFASDGFVRSRTFHGKKVISYSDALKKYGDDMIILLVFGSSIPEVMRRFYILAQKHELYAPDVPVADGEIFNSEFYEKNIDRIKLARSLLADEESVSLYDSVINYRLTGDIKYLANDLTDLDNVMKTILHPESYKITLDLGAYTGDTALDLISYAPDIEKIIALEPDAKNFSKLCINTSSSGLVEPHYAAAWDKRDILLFRKGGGRGIRHSENEKTVEVMAVPPDSLLNGRKPDFIKFDVEGAEKEAIVGCAESIVKYTPELQVALYHRSEDIFSIPLQIHTMNPSYRFYMRRFPYIPAWDLNLFAVK